MISSIVDTRRIRLIRQGIPGEGPVVYVMARDQRVNDNWALLYAEQYALERKKSVVVALPIAIDYPKAPARQKAFIIHGLKELERNLARLDIDLLVSEDNSAENLHRLLQKIKPTAVVTDYSPLRESRLWKRKLSEYISVPSFEVDSHNIVPVWETSDKQEHAAYTIRPKIHKLLLQFLTPFPKIEKQPIVSTKPLEVEGWSAASFILSHRRFGLLPTAVTPGETQALKSMTRFLETGLPNYFQNRNNPVLNGQSGLSPYLHFGQLAAGRLAWEAQRFDGDIASQESFLEELIVRRELSDNFCHYNEHYDSVAGFPAWARKTLDEHRHDIRPELYRLDQLEAGETEDPLWNAAQMEMVKSGKMHGFMRMYWAKKILQWSPDPETALETAIYLNDKYQLDGNDPNGYAGIAWSIGGLHDRAWSEREIFGKIRYMSFEGCKRKFDVNKYIMRVSRLE